ncbi:MAG: integrase [Rhodospirillaceae bacterium]|nr:integrase [Rhodospirillaceae bacterium]|tara:strand:+ start:351 stop:1370 length:1020 start_codon:yes stop_codon:yes gene_type:complete
MATIRKRGTKWQVQVRRKGQSSASRSFNSKGDARAWGRQMETLADKGNLDEVHQKTGKLTVKDLLVRYRDEVSAQKRGHDREVHVINALLREDFSRQQINEVSPSVFAAYRDRRLKEVQGTSIRRYLGIIQHAFDVAAQEWGWPIRENPIRSIRKPSTGNSRNRRLLPGEEGRVIDECRGCQNSWIVPCVRLALETAMRRSEILRMVWGDVDWEKRTLHIPETKNGHPRTIPLTEEAMNLLKRLPHSMNGRVIPISATCLRMAWDRALRRAGIKDLRFHDLRHEAITRFVERGLSVQEVALISGHRDYRMLARYTHLRPEDVGRKLTQHLPYVQKADKD